MVRQREKRRSANVGWQGPTFVGVVVWVIVAAPLYWAHRRSQTLELERVRSQTEFVGRTVANQLRSQVLSSIAALDTLVAHARRAPDLIPELHRQAEGLHAALPGVLGINWVDGADHIVWVVPREPNAAALGKSPLDSPRAKPSYQRTRETLTIQVTEPLTLFQGGVGVAVYVPIRESSTEPDLGVFNMVFRLDTLGELLLDNYTATYFHLSLRHSGNVLLDYGAPGNSVNEFTRRENIRIHDTQWEMEVTPSEALLHPTRSKGAGAWLWFSVLSTFSISILAGLYRFIAAERSRRTVDLERANETLVHAASLVGTEATLELDAIHDLLRKCCHAMGVTRTALWSFEQVNGSLTLISMFDERTDQFHLNTKIYVADYPEYWTAMCRDGRVVVREAALDPLTSKLHAERMSDLPRLAMLDVGIRAQERILGVFSFHRVHAGAPFRPEEQLLAQSMADLFALSWARREKRSAENAHAARNQRLTRHSNALAAIAALVAGEDGFEEVLPRVLKLVQEALEVTEVSYWVIDERDAVTAVHSVPARSTEDSPIPDLRRLRNVAQRIRQDVCVVVNDLAADLDYVDFYAEQFANCGPVSGIQSGVSTRRRLVGVLNVFDRERSAPWFPEEPIFVNSVANVLSLHLEMRARRDAEMALSNQVAALVRHSDALTNIAKSWLSDSTQAERFTRLTELAARALGTTSTSVWLEVSPQTFTLVDRFHLENGEHVTGAELSVASVPEYLELVTSKRVVSVVDAARDPRCAGTISALIPDEPHVSVMASAVRQKGNPVGFVTFVSAGRLRQWTPDEQLFAAALADLVSLSLEQEARRHAEQSMYESQQRTNLLVEGTPLAAIDWSPGAAIIGWNPAAERLFGYTREEAERLTYADLVATTLSSREEEWRELKSGVNLVERIPTRTKDGRLLTCDWRNTSLCDADGRELGIMSLVEDVTARVRAEAEVRQLTQTLERRVLERTAELADANQQLRELDRLKNEFVAMMSHELRTPLNSVIGFSSILKAGMAGPINDEQERQLEMINQSARHLLRLINDLLDLSRIEAGRVRLVPTDVDPGSVLEDVERTLRPMIAQKAGHASFRFSIENKAESVVLHTDRTRLLQILINLANNAVKFTAEGSVSIVLEPEGNGVVFRVTDTGPGISPQNMRQLFEAFRQIDGSARRAYEGTGLGLYLCKKLAYLLGGEVRVTSELGVGSCFSVWVPLRSEACAS